MAKFEPQQAAKRQKMQQVDSDSDQDFDDFDDDMLPGSDSSDDVMGSEGDDAINGDDVIPAGGPRQSAKDIAALAAAAHQQAAAYAARQRKAAAAAAGVQGVGEEEEEEGLSDDDMDGEGGSSEEEGEEAAAADGKRPHIYNADGMHEKLEDISWIDEQPWRESLVLTSSAPTQVEDVDDDLERELAFYNQAMSATAEAIARFESEGVSWLRPPDYYAEMVKSDEQMARIKDRLMYEQQQIDQAAERRKAREQKAYAKQVQAEKEKERAQEKKRQITQVQQLRKQREKSGFAGELDFDAEMNKGGGRGQQQQQQQRGKGGQKPGQRFNPNDRTPGKKRQLKNMKFGFGGKKRLQKQNDAFSAADMSGFKAGNRGGFGGKGGGGKGRGGPGGPKGGVKKKAGAAANRPGKARRQQQKQRKL